MKKQQHRLNRCPSVRASGAWWKDRCPVGLSSLDEGRNQVKNSIAPVEPMVQNQSTGALASEHPMLGGRTDALSVYLLWMQAGIKSKTL